MATLLALWALGGWWSLRRAETVLETAARSALGADKGPYAEVNVTFLGQTALLHGRAASASAAREAERRVREEVKIGGLNPVLAVRSLLTAPEGEPETDALAEARKKVQAEEDRAQPWVLFCAGGGQVKLAGVVPDVAVSVNIKREADRLWQGFKVTNMLRVDAGVAAVKELLSTLKQMPKPAEGREEQIATTRGDGVWMALPITADELTVAQALHGTDASLTEIGHAMSGWRSVRSSLSAEAATERARQEAALKPMSPVIGAILNGEQRPILNSGETSGVPQPIARPLAPVSPVKAKAVGPPYVGWARHGEEVWLFGAVLSEKQKLELMEQADRTFAGKVIHLEAVNVDPSRIDDGKTKLTLPSKPGNKPVGLLVAGRAPTSYEATVSDARVVADFRSIGVTEEEVGSALAPFRERLVAEGKLNRTDAAVSILSDGRVILVTGEVGDETSKAGILEALKPISSGMTVVHDGLRVSPLVKTAPEMTMALNRAPLLEAGKPMALAMRSGQAARRGVVHAVYSASGDNRSSDIPKAVRAMKTVFDLSGDAMFEIVGHEGGKGDAAADQALSLKQAAEVRDQLKAAGIDEARMVLRGAGNGEPVAENVSERGRAMNRRVDVRWLTVEPGGSAAR